MSVWLCARERDPPFSYPRTFSSRADGTSTPNYWKIKEYCGGDVNNASPENMWCYTCEPPEANTTLADFDFFPEPTFSPTWQAAVAYVTAGAASAPVQPVWDAGFINGQQWTDPNTGISMTLPGSSLYNTLKRDPYADLVSLAVDLGAAGVDVDYEEMWHADMHKQGPAGGPWTLPQTVYKYAAILKDVQLNIAAQAPALLLSSPTGAASGWAGNWWGGNLNGVVAGAAALYPDLIAFVARTGGINVMVRAAGIFAARARVLRWVLARQPAARRACVRVSALRVCAPRVCTPARLCTSTLLIPHASPPPRPQNLAKRPTIFLTMNNSMSAQRPQCAACTTRWPSIWRRTATPVCRQMLATKRGPLRIQTLLRTPRTSCPSP